MVRRATNDRGCIVADCVPPLLHMLLVFPFGLVIFYVGRSALVKGLRFCHRNALGCLSGLFFVKRVFPFGDLLAAMNYQFPRFLKRYIGVRSETEGSGFPVGHISVKPGRSAFFCNLEGKTTSVAKQDHFSLPAFDIFLRLFQGAFDLRVRQFVGWAAHLLFLIRIDVAYQVLFLSASVVDYQIHYQTQRG